MDLGFGKPVGGGMMIVGGGWRVGHAGLDIRLPTGTPILAMADGFVSSASASPHGEMGIYAVLVHASGVVSRYLHFSKLMVQQGQMVSRGDTIGLSGNTGLSGGPHLHVDLKVPSQEVLEQIASEVGEPANGFEPNITGYGIGIPSEPWIPVDDYEPQVIVNAQANGVPLYQPRGVNDIVANVTGSKTTLLLLGGAAILVYLLYRD